MRRQADDGRSLSTVAHAHEPLPEFPVLRPAAVTLALTSMAPKALDDAAPVLAPDETPVMRPVPVPVMAAAQSRKLKTTGGKTAAVNMTLKLRSSKNKAKAAASSPKVYKSN
ncbi:MAG: hypothetical protein MH252_10885 [Thermosynechococcaceae cyanobacterium MS004]|nr:hypothetical protein [Thermosynechococcaceae cyanobacterium MS004]